MRLEPRHGAAHRESIESDTLGRRRRESRAQGSSGVIGCDTRLGRFVPNSVAMANLGLAGTCGTVINRRRVAMYVAP